MQHPKLRDSRRLKSSELYPINEIPEDIIRAIGRHIVFLLAIGKTDISGTEWGDAFASAIEGEHLGSPIGIADVVRDDSAWSLKTVKSNNPFHTTTVRLISGRCSPDYSYGITDPHTDIQKTGHAVLNIWNERVNIAQDYYKHLRTTILVRSDDMRSFCVFEEENHRFRAADYTWDVNKNGNLIGLTTDGKTHFTWQPHGAQFTIHTIVPDNAVKFTIKRPPVITKEQILNSIAFDPSWVEIIRD